MFSSKRRVVVTGLGVISPVGNTVESTWEALLSAVSGIGTVTRFPVDNFPSKIAGEVKNFNPQEHLSGKEIKQMDTFMYYGVIAASEAVNNAGLIDSNVNPERVGVAIGSGIGGLQTIEKSNQIYHNQGPRRISPFFIPSCIINMISGKISIKYHFTGPNISLVSACTTGSHNIGESFRLINYGDADVMICGGSEAAITPLGLGSFASARALSTRNSEPEKSSRPFDKDRDGFVLGEGAGVIVLEEYEHAKKRQATIYAELVGYGMSADGYHITAPLEDGAGASRSMKNAISDAQVPLDTIKHINSHGTSTPLGDVAETIAIKSVFENHAKKIAINSTKSMTGHLLGAAGGIEAVFTILSLYHQVVPPTINLDNADIKCDLDYVPHTAREISCNLAMSNSFGFGGTNASLLFQRFQ